MRGPQNFVKYPPYFWLLIMWFLNFSSRQRYLHLQEKFPRGMISQQWQNTWMLFISWHMIYMVLGKKQLITIHPYTQGNLTRLPIMGFTKFSIKEAWSLQFWGCLRTLNLKFQKARTKIEVVLGLPCWLSQSGQLQFWFEPSEILNIRSWNTPETLAFTIPWYQTWWNP